MKEEIKNYYKKYDKTCRNAYGFVTSGNNEVYDENEKEGRK